MDYKMQYSIGKLGLICTISGYFTGQGNVGNAAKEAAVFVGI